MLPSSPQPLPWCPAEGPGPWPSNRAHRVGPVSSARRRAQGRPGCPAPPPPPLLPRIGRKPTLLVQLLLFGLIGLTTAFVPSFELYMALRFAVAVPVAGFSFSNVTLREHPGPPAFSHGGEASGSGPAPFPGCPGGALWGTQATGGTAAQPGRERLGNDGRRRRAGAQRPSVQLQSGWGPPGGLRPWSWPSAPSPWGRWRSPGSPTPSQTGGISR